MFRSIIFVAFFLSVNLLVAQSNFIKSENPNSKSLFLGGFLIKKSTLFIGKVGFERGHFGVVADITRDAVKEKWEVDNTKGHYVLWVYSLSGRYYFRPMGRSFFAEVGVGTSKANLTVDYGSHSIKKTTSLPLASWGLGWRFGKKPRGLFGEVGFRNAYALKERHLYTDATKPAGSTNEGVTYHSWYFKKGKSTASLYLGVGFSF